MNNTQNIFSTLYQEIQSDIKSNIAIGKDYPRPRIVVNGKDQDNVARTALSLMEENFQVILMPDPSFQFPSNSIDAVVSLNNDNLNIFYNPSKEICYDETGFDQEWDVVMYTSGTTGRAKPIALSKDQLNRTIDSYKRIYSTDRDTLLLSVLPASYNFTFISAAYQSKIVGNEFLITKEKEVIDIINEKHKNYSNIVVISNPIMLEILGNNLKGRENILFDSGGAPLSKESLKQFRYNGFNIREGYGLTETCSLSHFDIEGDDKSLGLVGKPVTDAQAYIKKNDKEKPVLFLCSNNIGTNLMEENPRWIKEINTGDLAEIDNDNRIRLLGREADAIINGHWPKDTLDNLGPVLGKRCATVRHTDKGDAYCRVLGSMDNALHGNIRDTLSCFLDLKQENIFVDAYNSILTHSIKIPSPVLRLEAPK